MTDKNGIYTQTVKFLLTLLLTVFISAILPVCVYSSEEAAEETPYGYKGTLSPEQTETIQQHIDSIDTQTFQEFISQSEIFENLNAKKLITDISFAGLDFNPENIIKTVLSALFKETYSGMREMVKLIVIVLITCLLSNMKQNFSGAGFNDISFFVCYILIMGTTVQLFGSSARIASDFIQLTHKFTLFFVPILFTVMAAAGGVISFTSLQPLLLGVSQIINFTVANWLLPLSMLAAAIGMVSCISEKFSISQFAEFIKTIVEWSLKFLMTIFIGAVSIQTLSSSALDSMSSKAAKFAVSSFIPIIGNILTDSIDLIAGCSKILKNSIGLAGIIVLAVIAVLPVIKLAANTLLLRLTIALIEPAADKRIIKCLNCAASSISGLMAMAITLEIMFLVSFSIVFCFTNVQT